MTIFQLLNKGFRGINFHPNLITFLKNYIIRHTAAYTLFGWDWASAVEKPSVEITN